MPSPVTSSHQQLENPINLRNDLRKNLRHQLRTVRNSISFEQHEESAFLVKKQLNSLACISNASSIAAYLVNDGELDLSKFIQQKWESKPSPTFSIPVLHPVCKGHLLFLQYAKSTPLVKNKYRIDEPELACQNVIPTHALDIILMPLVGLDNKGNRLGMGGGYYDRTLAFTRSSDQKPLLVGIAHDEQEVDTLPFASWDIPVDAIVTPTRILTFSSLIA